MINSDDILIQIFYLLSECEDIPLKKEIVEKEYKLYDKIDNYYEKGTLSKKEYEKLCFLIDDVLFINNLSSFIMGIKLGENIGYCSK